MAVSLVGSSAPRGLAGRMIGLAFGRATLALFILASFALPAHAWDGTSYNNLVNGNFSSSGSGWTTWNQNTANNVVVAYGANQVTFTVPQNNSTNPNGGIIYTFGVVSSHQYAFSG